MGLRPAALHAGAMTTEIQIDTPPSNTILLRRRADRRLLGGVCGGFADYSGADVGLIRVLMAALVLFGGAGIALYAAAWLLVPVQGSDRSPAERMLRR